MTEPFGKCDLAQQAPPVCMFVGSPRSGKTTIIDSIIGGGQSAISCNERRWNIDTKYYSAQALLREHCLGHGDGSPYMGGRPEAVVLVVDSMDAGSFAAARSWVETPASSSPRASSEVKGVEREEGPFSYMMDAEVKLLVATKVDLYHCQETIEKKSLEQQQQGWLSLRAQTMDWCVESGFEYIEVCPTVPELDAGLRLDGDVQGMGRVVEALHSHVWPGMERKGRVKGGEAAEDEMAQSREGEDEALRQSCIKEDQGGPPEPLGGPFASELLSAERSGGDVDDDKIEGFEKLFAEIQGDYMH